MVLHKNGKMAAHIGVMGINQKSTTSQIGKSMVVSNRFPRPIVRKLI